MSARDLAHSVYEWARSNGVLAQGTGLPTGEPQRLVDVTEGDPERLEYAQGRLAKARVVGVIADEEHGTVTILTKGALGPRVVGRLPEELDGVTVAYIGSADIETNPPMVPAASTIAQPPCHLHGGKIACGSSVTAAPVYGAGTFGCLVTTDDGILYGLTNNHVTGDCNHTPLGMHILSPAPMDADPNGPAPTGIGRHHSFVPLHSGDPQQVQVQELDVALFSVTDHDQVSSMQGSGVFNTPGATINPAGRMRVKKIGRTTGLTHGEVVGPWVTSLPIPYKSSRFSSVVHFTGAWGVRSLDGESFSSPGDSGSLVVTEDGQHAVGLIFAGAGQVSLMMPIISVMDHLNLALVEGHTV